MHSELLFGIHPVWQLLKTRKRQAHTLFLEENKTSQPIQEIIRLAKRNNVKIYRKKSREMDQLAGGGNHQGVALAAEPLKTLSLREALALDTAGKNALWLAADEISDPQNLGAMIRSAACLGAVCVVIPERRTVGITATVYKAASGAMETINIVPVVNLNQAILELKEHGFWIYGADMSGKPLPEVSYNTPLLLVIGSEGGGIRQKTAEHCDGLVKIPQQGGVENLNAACAASIVLYDIAAKTGIWKKAA